MTQATAARPAARRIARGLAEALDVAGPARLEALEAIAERAVADAEASMPRDLDALEARHAPSLAAGPRVLVIAQVLARELRAATDAQLAWVAGLAADVCLEAASVG